MLTDRNRKGEIGVKESEEVINAKDGVRIYSPKKRRETCQKKIHQKVWVLNPIINEK